MLDVATYEKIFGIVEDELAAAEAELDTAVKAARAEPDALLGLKMSDARVIRNTLRKLVDKIKHAK